MNASEILADLQTHFLAKDLSDEYEITHSVIALRHLYKLFANQAISRNLRETLIAQINQLELEIRQVLTKRLSEFLPDFLNVFFYVETDNYTSEQNALNTFVGYWTVLSHLNLGGNLLPPDLALKDKFALLLKKSQPDQINLRCQDLQKANLSYLILAEADFSYAQLDKASLIYAQLTRANFYNADLNGAQLMHINLREAYVAFTDLSKANLSNANLKNAVLHNANLGNADLSQADLSEANLDYTHFRQADLTLTNLAVVNGFQTDFQGANLLKTNCLGAKFQQAGFKNVIFYQTNFNQAELEDCDWEIKSAEKADFRTAKINQQTRNILRKKGALVD